jgi:putative hydrolase of the HAD superfamily
VTGFRPELILLDAGGTLVLIDPDQFGEFLARWDLAAVATDRLFAAHFQAVADYSRRLMSGETIGFHWWTHRFFEFAGLPLRPNMLQAFEGGPGMWTHPIQGAHQAVIDLRARGYRVAVVSNSDGTVAESLDTAGFGGLFELVIDSATVGISKPDPDIFRMALDTLEVTAGDAWYVGDSPYHDIGGAQAAGLGGAVLVDPLALGPSEQLSVESIAELPCLLP